MRLLIILLFSITLVACSNHNDLTDPKVKNSEEKKSVVKPREITAEELELTELIKSKSYDEVQTRTVYEKTQTQEDFYALASAFKVYEKYLKDSNSVTGYDFEYVILKLDSVTFIPSELSTKVKELRDWAIWKIDFNKRNTTKENAKGKIGIGMTKEEVKDSLGKPYDITKNVTAAGTSELWVYDNYSINLYVFFNNGIVTSYQKY